MGTYIYLSEKPIPWLYKNFKFMVISDSTKQDLVKRGLPAEDIHVIHCGIDHTLYHPESSVEKEPVPTVIYLGRLKKYKSIEHLLSAFSLVLRNLPQANLVVVGEGDYKSHLMDLANKFDIQDRVEFTGFVDKKEKVRRLRKAWVAVCPSLKEGWGLTNIEANACGTPVIASNVPGLKDSVVHGKTGVLYEYGNVQKLSEHLVKVLSDKEYREKLTKGGLDWAKKFSWDDAAERTLELIEGIAKKELRVK